MDEYKNETIEGRNAVTEALRAGRALDKVFIARGETDRALAFVAAKARAAGALSSSPATRYRTRTISAPSSAARSAPGPTG